MSWEGSCENVVATCNCGVYVMSQRNKHPFFFYQWWPTIHINRTKSDYYQGPIPSLSLHDLHGPQLNWSALITCDHKQLSRDTSLEPSSTSLCHQLSLLILPSSAFIAIFASQNPFPYPTGIMNPRLVLKSWNSRGLKLLKLQSKYCKIQSSM